MSRLLNCLLVLVIKYVVVGIHVVLILIKTLRYSSTIKSRLNPSSAKLMQVLMILNESGINLSCFY